MAKCSLEMSAFILKGLLTRDSFKIAIKGLC